MCVILPEAKHGVANRNGASEQRTRTQRFAVQCCNIPELDGDQQLELVNGEQRLLVSSRDKKRLPFHVFSSKCLQLPISLSWAESSCWNCTPDLQPEAVQDQDSGEQLRYPWEVPRLKWGKALRLWCNEASAVLS